MSTIWRVYLSLQRCAMAAATALVVASPSLAAEDSWKTAAGGVWGAGLSWADGTTPGASDSATFNLPGTYTATFNADPPPIQGLTLTNGANVTFASGSRPPNPIEARTLAVTSASGSGDVFIGDGAVLTLGATSGGLPTSGHPFHLTAGNLAVGPSGQGELKITAGGKVENRSAFIAGLDDVQGTGKVSVDGLNSKWINTEELRIGDSGPGTVAITNGGQVTSQIGHLGFNHFGSGQVIVSGENSLWDNSGSLEVGAQGSGNLKIIDGGTVRITNGFVNHFGGNGFVTVSGANSRWINLGSLTVGALGGRGPCKSILAAP